MDETAMEQQVTSAISPKELDRRASDGLEVTLPLRVD